MITSSVIFVLASYVGPHASPDSNLYQSPHVERQDVRNHSDYARPGRNRNAYASPDYTPPPKPEPPKPGRMVVPEKFL